MRWWHLLVLLASCGDDLGRAPATLVRVTTSRCDTCETSQDLYGMCGNQLPPLDTAGRTIDAWTSYSSTEIAGLVQVQYVTMQDYGTPYLDFILLEDSTADVPAIFGTPAIFAAPAPPPLYRVQPDGAIVDVDATRLTSAEDNALHFTYPVETGTVTEDHIFDAPRPVTIDAHTDICCSAGGPRELGVVFAVLLIRPRRRRRLRA